MFRLFHIMIPALIAGLCVFLPGSAALAQERFALVIGNSNYGPDLGPIATAGADAQLIAKALGETGFKVTTRSGVNRSAFESAVKDLANTMVRQDPNAVGLFYFTGHSVHVGNKNYLLPLGASIKTTADIETKAISLDWVVEQLKSSGSRTNLVIVDAARKTRLSETIQDIEPGLTFMNSPRGLFIALSTSPDEIGAPSTRENTPFAKALAAEIKKPDLSVEDAFRNVREAVWQGTRNRQLPWTSSGLTTRFSFASNAETAKTPDSPALPSVPETPVAEAEEPAAPQTPSAPVTPEPAATESPQDGGGETFAETYWEAIKNSSNPVDFESYLSIVPNGTFSDLARARLAELTGAQAEKPAEPPAEKTEEPAETPAPVEETPEPAPQEEPAPVEPEATPEPETPVETPAAEDSESTPPAEPAEESIPDTAPVETQTDDSTAEETPDTSQAEAEPAVEEAPQVSVPEVTDVSDVKSVKEDRSNIRERPAKDARILRIVDAGTNLTVTGEVVDMPWVRVALEDGTVGYIADFLLAPKASDAQKEMFTIRAANIRTEPTSRSDVLEMVDIGTPITVEGKASRRGWLKVTLPDGRQGFVFNRLLADEKPAEMRFAVIPIDETKTSQRDGKANVRSGPSARHKIITSLEPGTEIQLTGRVNDLDWYRVELENDTVGYISGKVLEGPAEAATDADEPETTSAPEPDRAARDASSLPAVTRVARRNANVRSGPSVSNRIITELTRGTRVTVIGGAKNGKWSRVRLSDGRTGYISSSLLAIPEGALEKAAEATRESVREDVSPPPAPTAPVRAPAPRVEPQTPPSQEAPSASTSIRTTKSGVKIAEFRSESKTTLDTLVRAEPSRNARVISIFPVDSVVTVRGQVVDQDWFLVETSAGSLGYVPGNALSSVQRPKAPAPRAAVPPSPTERLAPKRVPAPTQAAVPAAPRRPTPPPPAAAVAPPPPDFVPLNLTGTLVRNSNVRSGPSSRNRRVAELDKGTTVRVTGRHKDRRWLSIALPSGETGFIFAPLVGNLTPAARGPAPQATRTPPLPDRINEPARARATRPARTTELPNEIVMPAKAGEVFRDCPQCPEMTTLPPGIYATTTGAQPGPDGKAAVRTVRIAQPFAVGLYEITFNEWDACVADGGCDGYKPMDQGWERERRPVINVSWLDAQKYIAWLSRKTGKRYRLLTDKEWEYAARARSQADYAFGQAIRAGEANFAIEGAEGSGGATPFRRKTTPVGFFKPNRFGLYDVHGNVAEWVDDCAMPQSTFAEADSRSCTRRVRRGGSWADPARVLKLTHRDSSLAGLRDSVTGFRIARDL